MILGSASAACLHGDAQLVMLGAERLGGHARVGQLVLGLRGVLGIADAEGLERAARIGGAQHRRRDQGRVEPAREERADGNFGHQADLGGVVDAPLQLVGRLGLGRRRGVARLDLRQIPVARHRDLAAVPLHDRRRRQLLDAAEHRQRRRDIAQGEVGAERVVVDGAVHLRHGQERLDLGAEHQVAAQLRVVERLDAQAVAREDQLLDAVVPDGEGEHAAELLGAVGAPFFVGVDDDFGVGVGTEACGRARLSSRRSSMWL